MILRILIALLLPLTVLAQPTAKQLIAAANKRFGQVNSYSAAIQLDFNIPGVQLQPINGKVYYKKPNKFKINAKGIIFLPKQNPYYALESVRDTNTFAAFIAGQETVGSVKTTVVNVIPSNNNDDLILGKFWVDETKQIIHKAQLTTKSNGTITIEQQFGNFAKYGLPDAIRFIVDVAKFKIPKAVAMEINSTSKPKQTDEKQKGNGVISLNFSNYKLNEAIDNKLFEDDTASK